MSFTNDIAVLWMYFCRSPLLFIDVKYVQICSRRGFFLSPLFTVAGLGILKSHLNTKSVYQNDKTQNKAMSWHGYLHFTTSKMYLKKGHRRQNEHSL